jgi:hypothetical protein
MSVGQLPRPAATPTRLRRETAIIGSLLALAAAGWAISAVRMAGMDAGPGGNLGAAGWFMATWVAMMTAMMLPVAAPLAVQYQRSQAGRVLAVRVFRGTTFVGGYVAVWAAAGLLAYEVVSMGRPVLGGVFAWDRGGRWAAVAMLFAAAGYQLTTRKRRSLERPAPARANGPEPSARCCGMALVGARQRTGAACPERERTPML